MRRLLIPEVALALAAALAACQQQSPAAPEIAATVDPRSFHSCVDREAKAAFQRAINRGGDLALYGYHTDIANDIISICSPQMRREVLHDSVYSNDANYSYVNAIVEAQYNVAINEKIHRQVDDEQKKAKLDAPRLKAEKAEEHDSGAAYFVCLDRHAKILSLNSNESAEVIVQASFPSCSGERKAVFEVYRRHNNSFDLGSGLIDHSQKMRAAAMHIAEK